MNFLFKSCGVSTPNYSLLIVILYLRHFPVTVTVPHPPPEQRKNFKAAVCSTMNVSLVGDRSYVLDQKFYFVDFDNKDEAYFMFELL